MLFDSSSKYSVNLGALAMTILHKWFLLSRMRKGFLSRRRKLSYLVVPDASANNP